MGAIERIKKKFRGYKHMFCWLVKQSTMRNRFGLIADNAVYEVPCNIDCPEGVYLHENARLRSHCSVFNSPACKLIINKHSVIACGCTFITDGHRSTVGIPQFLLGTSHINDKSGDIVVKEDVWIGANCTIMPGVTIGRGAVVGACSIVTKDVPPYAVVVGSPAKIVAKKFSFEDILSHEEVLYSESERMPEKLLKKIYQDYLEDKKVFGVNTPLSPRDEEILQAVKKARRYIEPY